MIEEHVKIHDNFSVEIKLGFVASKTTALNKFMLNIWTFIPDSLDINRFTYSKVDFYRDIKTNIRLITPAFLLREILESDKSPFVFLERSFKNLVEQQSKTNKSEYEYQIKMFNSIFRSSLREESNHILNNRFAEDDLFLVEQLVKNVVAVSTRYRQFQRIINIPTISKNLLEYYVFGDEFMSNTIENYCFRLVEVFKKRKTREGQQLCMLLLDLIRSEIAYRKSRGYLYIKNEETEDNHEFVFRLGMLKKYTESHLFLNIKKRKDGRIAEQLLFSIAAGISMIFATIIAFSFQQKYGSYTMPVFVVLVVSYMLKDRIKELGRYYFAHKMGARYFDHKIDMSINNNSIGWIKESVDFISEPKVPEKVLKVRNRSSILEANNRANKERILLYRTLMKINGNELDSNSKYPFSGVNAIIRFNVSHLIQKMDNPDFLMYVPEEGCEIKQVKGEKIYYLNFIIQQQHESQLEYKRYRVVFNRLGIKKIECF